MLLVVKLLHHSVLLKLLAVLTVRFDPQQMPMQQIQLLMLQRTEHLAVMLKLLVEMT